MQGEFATFAEAESYQPTIPPSFMRTAFYDTDQLPGSGALYKMNGTTVGDLVITLDDGVTGVGYTIAEPVVRASMFDRSAANAMNWLKPLLERGAPRVVVSPGIYDVDANVENAPINLQNHTRLTFESVRFIASLASVSSADRVISINTNGFNLSIDGQLEIDGNQIAPIGLHIVNGTTTYSRLVIEEGVRVINCKRAAVATGQGCMGIYIGGAYENPKVIRPYVFNCNRISGGGNPGVIGTHGLTITSNAVGGTYYWPRNPYVEEPFIERILSEEAFDSDSNHDCDCLRIFTFDSTPIGYQRGYGNSCTISGGVYKDFRGRAVKTQSGHTSILGRVKVSVDGSVAKGIKNADFQIVGIQSAQSFNIDTLDIEIGGSGVNDPFQGLWGGTVVCLYSPGNLGRGIYRGNISNVVLRFYGDVGISSGFDTIIQGGTFAAVPSSTFMLNVNNVACEGIVNNFMEIPGNVQSNYHNININNISVNGLSTAAFVANSSNENLQLLVINIGNFFNGGIAVPETKERWTDDPLDATVNRSNTVHGLLT